MAIPSEAFGTQVERVIGALGAVVWSVAEGASFGDGAEAVVAEEVVSSVVGQVVGIFGMQGLMGLCGDWIQ